MKRLILFACVLFAFYSCKKNTVSKIPSISLIQFFPKDSMIVGVDTPYIYFSITDGDGDIGNSGTSKIYLKDSRFDTTYAEYGFPNIDGSVEDPKKGITASCILLPTPPIPRDSLHFVIGDTMHYEMYIKDRAGNQSNHIILPQFVVKQ